MANYHEIMLM